MTSRWFVSYTYQYNHIGSRIFKNKIIDLEDDERMQIYGGTYLNTNTFNLTEGELSFIRNKISNEHTIPEDAVMIIFFSRMAD